MQVVEVLAKLKKGCAKFPFFKERRGACKVLTWPVLRLMGRTKFQTREPPSL